MERVKIVGHPGGMWTARVDGYGVIPIIYEKWIENFSPTLKGRVALRRPNDWFNSLTTKRSRFLHDDWDGAMLNAAYVAISGPGTGESWSHRGIWRVSDFKAPTAKTAGSIVLHEKVAEQQPVTN
jgi:hypothetical protein